MPSEDRDRQMVWWIAEKVMGWRRAGAHPLYVGDHGMPSNGVVWHVTQTDPCHIEQFAPLTSKSEAMDALDAWCDADSENRRYDVVRLGWANPPALCRLIDLSATQVQVAGVRHDTLPRAICEALCKATGFEG